MSLKDPLNDWVAQSAWDPIVVSNDINLEARENLSRFSCDLDRAKTLTTDDLIDFICAFIDIKIIQLIKYNNNLSMIAYIWFEEITGSLCIGIMSKFHLPRLPFVCQTNINVGMKEIIGDFLRSRYLEGIPYKEFTFSDPLHTKIDMEEAGDSIKILDVHIIALNVTIF